MESLMKNILTSRPKISDGSLKTYGSILSSLYKKMNGKKKIEDTDDITFYFVKHPKETLDFLKDLEARKRKTTLSALTVISNGHQKTEDIYRAKMKEDSDYVKDNQTNEKTDKQKKEWMDWKDIQKIHADIGKEVTPLWTKENRTVDNFNALQDYVLLSLYVCQDPRRSEDYSKMMIRNVDKKDKNVNYIEKSNFVFQKYKTASLYGVQKIPINPKLKPILTKWMKVNTSDWLLVTPSTGKPLTIVQMNQRLNKATGKKIGSSMLRHIFLSSLYDVKKMEETATNMAHTVSQAINTYAKQ